MGGVGKGNLLRSKVANKKWYKIPHARGIFASSMQNRQLVCLKRIPINNRKDTPSIPSRGLRAQGKKKPKCLLAFQDIWHSCDYIFFLQSIKENKLTQY
jgi:hypothetical protein